MLLGASDVFSSKPKIRLCGHITDKKYTLCKVCAVQAKGVQCGLRVCSTG